MPIEDNLSRLPRYEAIFELSSEINKADDIAQVCDLLAHRLKYVADVFSWRYFAIESKSVDLSISEKKVLIIDGFHGEATLEYILFKDLSKLEFKLWSDRRIRFISGKTLTDAQGFLPKQFQKSDINQLFVCPHLSAGEIRGLFIYSKRRQPFNELDVKFITLASHFFHEKVHMLWEQKKLRDLEKSYLQQEIMMRQNEKLATLGKLSSGMAHELNNPVSAVLRGAEQLDTSLINFKNSQFNLGQMNLSDAQLEKLEILNKKIYVKSKHAAEINPLGRNDLENELETWLEKMGIKDSWELTSTLVDMNYSKDELTEISENFSSEQFHTLMSSLSSDFTAHKLSEEIRQSAERITQIVNALKSYTYLDQASIQSVDIHEGLDNSLFMLGSQINESITIEREYTTNLPLIEAYGSELNQVWTNLLDNSINAMNGKGKITIKTYKLDEWLIVELQDSGPGIMPEIQSKIFDPFFTTKQPGEGTGMGLNICHNIIVQKHKGEIKVRSKPGDTCFQIKLPLLI
jgi:signal transduction histidine kinase